MLFLGGVQRHPGLDSDKMDDELKNAEDTIKRLREIRTQLEEIFTGALI